MNPDNLQHFLLFFVCKQFKKPTIRLEIDGAREGGVENCALEPPHSSPEKEERKGKICASLPFDVGGVFQLGGLHNNKRFLGGKELRIKLCVP